MSNGLNQKNDKIDLNMIYYRIESIITLFYTKRILLLKLQVSLPIALHFTSFMTLRFQSLRLILFQIITTEIFLLIIESLAS